MINVSVFSPSWKEREECLIDNDFSLSLAAVKPSSEGQEFCGAVLWTKSRVKLKGRPPSPPIHLGEAQPGADGMKVKRYLSPFRLTGSYAYP